MRRPLVVLSVVGVAVAVTASGLLWMRSRDADFVSSFALDPADLRSTGTSPFFVLEPGYVLELRDERIELLITVLDEVERIGEVETRVVEEREWEDGGLIEVSRNFFAISTSTGDVFYFGEDVDIYENGRVVGHEGAWRAGADGARAGLMMSGAPSVGSLYYQEVAPGVAMDRAEVVAVDDTLTTLAGRFTGVLRVAETSPLEPLAREHKLYAPGVGLLRDGSAELVRYGTPAGPGGAPACWAPDARVSLDHVVLAATDLEAASGAYAELGFTQKEGRLHPNGLLNRHVKLADGTELELMTVAGAPGDDVARAYAEVLRGGGGGAYLALAAPQATVQAAAAEAGLASEASHVRPNRYVTFPEPGLDAVFFLESEGTAVDPDSLLTHANGAAGLSQVWLEAAPGLGRLLETLGAVACPSVRLPDGREGNVYGVANGSIVVVPAGEARPRVLGASVVGAGGGNPRWRPPRETHGLWLGLPDSPPEAGLP